MSAPPRWPRSSTGVSSAFGTFGELLQGVDEDGIDFLVTFPVACWSTATFRVLPELPGIEVLPSHKDKAARLARAMLSAVGYCGGGRLQVVSRIPEGKGLASSSADLVATARAVANAFGRRLHPQQIEALLRPLEPTDGVMYDCVAAFNHRAVELRYRIGSLAPITVIGVDTGGVVDTVGFNQQVKPYLRRDRVEFTRLLQQLCEAIAAGSLDEIGRISTRSAQINQRYWPKRRFDDILAICRELGGSGIVTAHSGTMLGVLIPESDPHHSRKVGALLAACHRLIGNSATYHSLTFESGGGPTA